MSTGKVQKNQERERPSIKAVIFDFDGLIVDSEPLWTDARNEVLGQFGFSVTSEDKRRTMGGGYREGLNYFIVRYRLPLSDDDFAAQEQAILDELYKTKLTFKPGVTELVNSLKKFGVPLAIATSGPRSRLNSALEKLSLTGIGVVVTGDDIEKGKPDPEIFIKTANKLGADPKFCVVLEDSPLGVMAARAAGMHPIAVYDQRYTSEADFTGDSRAEIVVSSLEDLNIQKLLEVFKCE